MKMILTNGELNMKTSDRILIYAIAENLGIKLKEEIEKVMFKIEFPEYANEDELLEEHHPLFGTLMFVYRDDKWHLLDK
jgi:hypothetical protein